MRTFKRIGSGKCFICGTKKKGECILIGIDGTASDGNEQAEPIHVDCLDLRLSRFPAPGYKGLIYQKIKENK